AFDKEFSGHTGSHTDLRPEKLAAEEAAHREWLKNGRVGEPPLWSIQEYAAVYHQFVERYWNAEHVGKGEYLNRMTPAEAWEHRLPPGGLRKLTLEEILLHTSDHRFLKVARGGQVNFEFNGHRLEYESWELLMHIGEEVEAIIPFR